mmetsp:Transcript_152249/g.280616  ORF Transcript_152249/g.280616 Transcript_152249/m.280616 type:complete len:520 (+) Transcript_152249:798-2357(+)
MQQKAVEFFVFHAVLAVASCNNPAAKIFLAQIHLALRLTNVCSLLADVVIDVVEPVVEIDEPSVLSVDALEKLHASIHLLFWGCEELCHGWCKTKATRHACSSIHHDIKVCCCDLAVKIGISLSEALEQELVELTVLFSILAPRSTLDEFDKILAVVFRCCNTSQLCSVDVLFGWSWHRKRSLLAGLCWYWCLGHEQTCIKRLCLLANVSVAEVEPCFEVDVASTVVHLVEDGFATCCLLRCGLVQRTRWWCKAEETRGICSHIYKEIECLRINAAIQVRVSLGEAMQQEAVELLVFHAVSAGACCNDPRFEIFCTVIHLALRLINLEASCLLADVRVDVVEKMVKVDVARVVGVNGSKECIASFNLVVCSAEDLSHCRREAKDARQASCNIHQKIKIRRSDFTVKITICLSEALEQKLVQLVKLCRIARLRGSLDELDKSFSAVFSVRQGDRRLTDALGDSSPGRCCCHRSCGWIYSAGRCRCHRCCRWIWRRHGLDNSAWHHGGCHRGGGSRQLLHQ